MNLPKAIEIKSLTGEEFLKVDPHGIVEADRLSVEALRAIYAWRLSRDDSILMTLVGETEE